MLTIYRASAGTGKTHTLTGRYLDLLFGGQDMHARILSVTFTNKATGEMKNRIIEELNILASGKDSDYLDSLKEKYRENEVGIRLQARKILIRILHDYAAFNISTIDHFFQQTMRAFIREIGLQGNYRVEMDVDLVLSESIDNLLADLDKTENKDLLEWLLRFSEDKVEKGENWDLRREIRILSYELFKEQFKASGGQIGKDIEDKEALTDYKNTLFAIIRSTEAEAKQIGKEVLSVLAQHNLHPSDFKGGSRSPLFFFERLAKGIMKEPTESFRKLAGDVEACYTKKTSADKIQCIEQAFAGGLGNCIEQTIRFFDQLTDYYTAREITRYYYTLGILNDIAHHIMLWREEKNRMLIADTTELLNRIIDGSDVPFIYEKTGTRIEHYMIDEFQDTSKMQWRNFRPLIKESQAYRRASLIVGDVKQSIYRFRNSDWTLLDEQVRYDFAANEIAEETLDVNWRSHRNIVEFNNTFFTIVPALLQQVYNQGLEESTLSQEQRDMYATKIMGAYAKSVQKVAPRFQSKAGHVRVEFLPDEEDKNWKEEAMLRLPLLVERLQENGYELRDIAILVRTRKEGMEVAETLLEYKEAHPDSRYSYDIISEDALIVSNSSAVRFMISMVQYVNRPEDPVVQQFALMAHTVMCRKAHVNDVREFVLKSHTDSFSDETLSEIQRLSHRSFYEMVEGIYRLFKSDVPDSEQIFVQAFLDIVADFVERESVDADRFLKWWRETGVRNKIATPDSQNAIRILTIHKSKGLGFKAVIIPFGDWDVDQMNGSIVWCRPDKKPFDKLHLVPVNYSKELNKTHFANEYYHEKLHAYIDNLNALYVAFTRAKEELIIFTPHNDVKRTKPISSLIWESMQVSEVNEIQDEVDLRPLSEGFDPDESVFEWGSWWQTSSGNRSSVEEKAMSRIPSVLPDNRIHLRLHRKGGFFDDQQRRYGLLMHDLLSQIRTADDIPLAISAKESAGEIGRDDCPEIKERLIKLLDQPQVKPWFDGTMQVMNEAEILFENGKSRRPDRIMFNNRQGVVVDYKFGEQKDVRHHFQVKRYQNLLRKMGYENVKGYLWYVELNEIETV